MSDHSASDSPLSPILEGGQSPAGWSRLGTILKCLRLAGLKYGSRGVPDGRFEGIIAPATPPVSEINQPSLAQAEGIVLHLGLAHHYALIGIEQNGEVLASDAVYTSLDQLMDPVSAMKVSAEGLRKTSGFSVDVERLSDCLAAYKEFYRYDEWRILAVESIISARVEDPGRSDAERDEAGKVVMPINSVPRSYLYTARADAIWQSNEFREHERRIYVVDHKGHSGQSVGPMSPTVMGYSASGQIHGLGWLGRQVFGDTFGGVLLNMVGRNPPFKFSRPPLDSAKALIERFPQTIIDAERRLADAEASPRLPKDWTPAANDTVCVGRYGVCPAWEKKLCQW